MQISREEVQRIVSLARLELTTAEEAEFVEHLTKVLTYVAKLNQLNIDGVEPTAHAVTVPAPLRDDRVTNQANTDALLDNAPARETAFFKVPKILE